MMVVYSAKPEFYWDVMLLMNNLRQNGSFCDITLSVGNGQVQAHRCVLAARSQYFHSLFLGQFVEATMPKVCLAEVTNDVDALELIIDFMYTGKIDINNTNLGVILKLSTFFLVDALREFCLEFMKSNLDLQTCLRFFLYAIEYNLSDIEHDAKLIVTSRFHDFIILEESCELSPGEVLFLMSNKMFEHCSTDSIFQFLGRWVIQGVTEEHVSVANQILDSVPFRNMSPLQCSSSSDRKKSHCTAMLDKLTASLSQRKLAGLEKFLKKSEQIVIKLFSKLDVEIKNYNLRLPSTSKQLSRNVDMEKVVVTVSPRQCVIDTMDQAKLTSFPIDVTYTEPVFTMNLYAPRTKAWYHMQDFKAEGAMGDLLEELCFGASVFMFTMYKEELVVMFSSDDMHFYNFRENTWRTVHVTDLVESDLGENEYSCSFDHCYVTGKDSIYLILKVKIFEDTDFDDPVGEYFKGYKLEENGQSWINIFRTETERDHACANSEIQAKVSSVSNELIFTHGPCFPEMGYSHVFIFNLNKINSVPVNILKVKSWSRESSLIGVQILETRQHFYIVKDGTSGVLQMIKYEYKFNSLSLSKIEDRLEKAVNIRKLRASKDDISLCSAELTTSTGRSLWAFEGNGKSVSFLYELVVNSRYRNLTVTHHTPPPFSCITAMFAGEVTGDLLDQLHPVTRFLHSD